MPKIIRQKIQAPMTTPLPSLMRTQDVKKTLDPYLNDTPTLRLPEIYNNITLYAKFEIWQQSGSFKFRGALNSLLNLPKQAQDKGVIAISAGNHAIAVCLAAKLLNIKTTVVMPKFVDPSRIAKCKALGAKVCLGEDMPDSFKLLNEIINEQNLSLIHPFEGIYITEGTGTIALEMHQAVSDLDAIVVAIGGGGLISGAGHTLKMLNPNCMVYGVEPTGANAMSSSFLNGKTTKVTLSSMVHSLSAPQTENFSYSACTNVIDGLVNITDKDTKRVMKMVHDTLGLAIDPAAVISLAAIDGPLKSELLGKKVGIIFCGSNLDFSEFNRLIN